MSASSLGAGSPLTVDNIKSYFYSFVREMFSCSHLQAGDGVSFPCCLRECAFSSRFRQRTMNQCPDMCQFLSISINKHTFLYCFFLLYTMVRPVKGSTNTKLLWQLPSGIFCHCDHRPSDEKIIIIFFGRICRYP